MKYTENELQDIRDPTIIFEPTDYPSALTLPPDHPCYGCPIVDLTPGKIYCLLPKCNRAIFESMEVRGDLRSDAKIGGM